MRRMQYHQKQYPFYNPSLIRMSMGACDLTVNYVDMLDETCVESLHVHKDYEIYYCLEGTQHIMVADDCCTMTSGSFLIVPPGTYHHTLYEPQIEKQYTVFVFNPPTLNTAKNKSKSTQYEDDFIEAALRHFDTVPYFLGRDTYGSRAILSDLHREIVGSTSGRNLMINALYQQYLISILRCLFSEEPQPIQPVSSNINLAIAIGKYMHANYHRNITIQDIADEFYISSRHVNRVFEDFFGQSFKRTLNIFRLNYAKNYLIDTDYSAEKIADLVGLSSAKILYQLFREIEGYTLAEFRTQNAKKNPAAAK